MRFLSIILTFILLSITPAKALAQASNSNDISYDDIDALFGVDEADEGANLPDELEGINRVFFDINIFLDRALISPPAKVYDVTVPKPVKKSVRNFFKNWQEPTNIINYMLQLNGAKTRDQMVRFFLNTTIGVGGLFDYASTVKYYPAPTDFGLTLAAWGVPKGGYIVLPVFGSNTYRSALGRVGGFFMGPTSLLEYSQVASAQQIEAISPAYTYTNIISARAQNYKVIEDAKRSSTDFYKAAQSFFWQDRRKKIRITLQEDDELL